MYYVEASTLKQVLQKYFSHGADIPEYQRDYVWSQEDARSLYLDLTDHRTSYMGPMVVVPAKTGGRVEVVDGQQRMTSISLLFYCIRTFCKYGRDAATDDNAKYHFDEAEQKTTVLIGENTRSFITHDLDKEKKAYQEARTRTLDAKEAKSNESRIIKCWDTARDFIFEQVFNAEYKLWIEAHDLDDPEHWNVHTSRKMLKLFDQVVESKMTPIEVAGEETAFLVFERLNSKGVPLSAIELIKNTIMRRSREINGGNEEFPSIKDCWSHLRSCFKKINMNATEAILTCLSVLDKNFRNSTKASLYEDAKNFIDALTETRACSNFTHELAELAEQLSLLHSAKFNAGSDYDRQPYPLLVENNYKSQWAPILFAHNKSPEMGIATAEFAFRILIRQAGIKGRGNRIGKELREHLYNVLDNDPADADSLYEELCETCNLDDSDTVMRDLLADGIFKSNSIAKTILLLCCTRKMPADWDRPDLSGLELEHVLPQNPSQWTTYQVGDDPESTIRHLWSEGAIQANYESRWQAQAYSIGNCALLHQSLNKEISNKNYCEKRSYYKAYHEDDNPKGSSFPITHSVDKIASENGGTWTKECIQKRAMQIATEFLLVVPANGRRQH